MELFEISKEEIKKTRRKDDNKMKRFSISYVRFEDDNKKPSQKWVKTVNKDLRIKEKKYEDINEINH
jgi:hypothetical protein